MFLCSSFSYPAKANTQTKTCKDEHSQLTLLYDADNAPPPPRTKVYLPKPIRVSPTFSRTSSYNSLASGASNSDDGYAPEKSAGAAEVLSFLPMPWPPLFELDGGEYGVVGGGNNFLDDGYILPVLNHSDSISSDVNMLKKVYNEYLQLL